MNMWSSPEDLSPEILPARTREELTYLAFASDLIGAQRFPKNDQDLRSIRWFARCRDLAIEAGGMKPKVMRLEI